MRGLAMALRAGVVLGALVALVPILPLASAKRVLVSDELLDADTHRALLQTFDAHLAQHPGVNAGEMPVPNALAEKLMRVLLAGEEPHPRRQLLFEQQPDGHMLVPFAQATKDIPDHHDHSVHRSEGGGGGGVRVQLAEGWSGLLYLDGDGLLTFTDVKTREEQSYAVKPGRFFAWKNDRHTHRLVNGKRMRKMLGPVNTDADVFHSIGIPPQTLTLCPALTGLRCTQPALVPATLAPCANSVDAAACRRRRQLGRIMIAPQDCPMNSVFAQVSEAGQGFCAASACIQWAEASGWVTAAIDSNPCPTLATSDAPVAITATGSATSVPQAGLFIFTVTLRRPAGTRRRLVDGEEAEDEADEEEEEGRRDLAWGATTTKNAATYTLRVDLPGSANVTVKRVQIRPLFKPKAPVREGNTLVWSKVPLKSSPKWNVRRTFKVAIKINPGATLGAIPFTATVFRVNASNVATDLHQAVVFTTVTPGGGKK